MTAHQQQMQGFAKYNREFNARLYKLAATLTEDERKKDLGAFFGSVHATLNHILLADRIWLGRFATAFPTMAALQRADLVQQFSSLRDELYANFTELSEQRVATDDVITRFTDELTPAQLAGTMRYSNSQGQQRQHPTWVAVAHMFNHQTHHRGQLSTLLHQLGHDVGVTDFVAYVT
ncbi:DinB family protein [Rheinheimera baltica]|uniref:DinB family protein n=1 Tax=Rheinheimera baltica TaxID=67576 RepID=UPI00273E2F03|nr:DinB family protein [Rheinheimera baltica]MDP5148730.1 DinB family protein [Rheinheimera baltica]